VASVDLVGPRGETQTATDLGTLQHLVNVRGFTVASGTYATAAALLSGYTPDPVAPKVAASLPKSLTAFRFPGMVPAVAGPAVPAISVSTNTSLSALPANQQTATYLQEFVALDDVYMVAPVFPNYTPNAAGANAITITAGLAVVPSVTLYSSVTRYPVFFSGQRSVTIQPGAEVIADPVHLFVPKGQVLQVSVFVSVGTAGQSWPIGHASAGCSVTATDNTLTANSAVWVTVFGNYGYTPSVILGTTKQPHPVMVGLIGDSIVSGEHDNPVTAGGYERGLLAAGVPFTKTTLVGETANNLTTQAARQYRGRYLAGCTHVLGDYGVNDFSGSRTAAQIAADLLATWAWLNAQGMKVYWTTITPRTTSTDSFATTTNQTPVAGAAAPRAALNDWLRAGAPVNNSGAYVAPGTAGANPSSLLSGVIDIAALVESSVNSGVWNPADAFDGVHPSTTAHGNKIAPAVQAWAASLS
jgi:hypothetical protein